MQAFSANHVIKEQCCVRNGRGWSQPNVAGERARKLPKTPANSLNAMGVLQVFIALKGEITGKQIYVVSVHTYMHTRTALTVGISLDLAKKNEKDIL